MSGFCSEAAVGDARARQPYGRVTRLKSDASGFVFFFCNDGRWGGSAACERSQTAGWGEEQGIPLRRTSNKTVSLLASAEIICCH